MNTITINIKNADILDTRDTATGEFLMTLGEPELTELDETLGMIRRPIELLGGEVRVQLGRREWNVTCRFSSRDKVYEGRITIDEWRMASRGWIDARNREVDYLIMSMLEKLVASAVKLPNA